MANETLVQQLPIDLETMTVTIPVGAGLAMVLIDPKRETAKMVPLADHGDVVVKCYQGRITGYDERKSYRFE
jgi:hypothetical protein